MSTLNKYICLFIMLGIQSCSSRRAWGERIFFAEILQDYDLDEYDIVLKTCDTTLNFSDARLLVDGSITATQKTLNYTGKDIIFYSRETSSKLVKYIHDTLGQFTKIKFSQEGIRKIEVYTAGAQGHDRKILYLRGINFRQLVLVLSLVAGCFVVGAYIYIIVTSWAK